MLRKCDADARLWQLGSPDPVPVRWRIGSPELMDWPDAIAGGSAGRVTQLRWQGRSDRIGEMAESFRSMPRRRAVILGEPGAGKTVLAVLLARELARQLGPDRREPVPVPLSLGSWDPGVSLRSWIASQLEEQSPALRAADQYGSGVARALIEARLVMPVLDGLDELAEGLRARALRAINDAFPADMAVVLTCRKDQYRETVGAADQVLTAAAVVEVEPLRTEDAVTYLERCVPPRGHHVWAPVFERLRGDATTPLAVALRTPLAVWLVRTTYVDGGGDPAVLLDTARYPGPAAIERDLLARLAPTVCSRATSDDLRAGRRWPADRSVKWLEFLAAHLEGRGTRDFAWWHLPEAVPVLARRLPRAVLVGLVSWLVAGVLIGIPAAVWLGPSGLAVGAAFGVTYGVTTAVAVRLIPARGGAYDLYAPLRVRAMGRTIGRALLTGLAFAVTASVVLAAILAITGEPDPLLVGAGAGWTFTILFGVPYGLAASAGLLAASRGPRRSVFRLRGRASALARAVRTPVHNGLVYGCATGVAFGVVFFVPVAMTVVALGGPPEMPAGLPLALRLVIIQAFITLMVLVGAVFGVVWGILWGLVTGAAVGFVLGFTTWTGVPVAAEEATRPVATLRADRRLVTLSTAALAAVFGLTFAAVFGAIAWLVALLSDNPLDGILSISLLGTVLGCVVGIFSGEWPYYLLARLILAARGRLPWSLMPFLDHAHQLGLLRQVGAAYQFRHGALQAHLAGRSGGRSAAGADG